MAKVKILYLTAGGTYREGKGDISQQWSGAVDNKKDKEIHSLVLNPVFPQTPPIPLKTWEELLSMPTPLPIGEEGKDSLMVCEEDNVLPLSSTTLSSQETEQVALNARENIWEEGKQKARAKAAQMDAVLQSWALVLVAGGLGFLVLVFGFLLLLQRFG